MCFKVEDLLFIFQALSMQKARQQAGSAGFLPTSLHKLDTTLHGGLPPATITEVHNYDVMHINSDVM